MKRKYVTLQALQQEQRDKKKTSQETNLIVGKSAIETGGNDKCVSKVDEVQGNKKNG